MKISDIRSPFTVLLSLEIKHSRIHLGCNATLYLLDGGIGEFSTSRAVQWKIYQCVPYPPNSIKQTIPNILGHVQARVELKEISGDTRKTIELIYIYLKLMIT